MESGEWISDSTGYKHLPKDPIVERVIDSFRSRSRDGIFCLLYTSPSPRDRQKSRMPSSA